MRSWPSVLVLLAAVAVLLALPTRSRAAGNGDPAVSSVEWNGGQYVFWRGADNGLWEQYADSSGWHAATEVPGTAGELMSAPSAMVWSRDNQLYVFWRDAANGLSQAYTVGNEWSGTVDRLPWTAGTVSSAPSAMEWTRDNQTYVYWQGPDAGLWQTWTINGAWSGRNNELPWTVGKVSSAPSAMEWTRDNQTYVFWRGPDTGLWQTWTINGAWSGTNNEIPSTGNDVLTAPSAMDWKQQTYVFWRGPDAGLWEAWTANDVWDGPVQDVGSNARSNGTTTPVLVPVPTPSRRRRGHHRRLVTVKLAIWWTWNTSGSTLDRAVLSSRAPRAATVKVACAGHGCPRLRRTIPGEKPRRVLRSLAGLHFRPGDRFFITISAPGRTPERIQARVRNIGLPVLRLL